MFAYCLFIINEQTTVTLCIDIIRRRPGVINTAFLALMFLSVCLTLVQYFELFVSAFLYLTSAGVEDLVKTFS